MVAAGAALAGVIVYSAYKLNEKPPLAGESIYLKTFESLIDRSKSKSWGEGHVQPSSFLQKDFTLPAGHTFHRLSNTAETSFNDLTYTASSMEDFNRYVAVISTDRASENFHHLTFKAKEEIRVPSLTHRLETLHKVLGPKVSEKDVIEVYNVVSGTTEARSDTVKKYFDVLRNEGYDAIVDDMDAGVISESPLVIINPLTFSEKQATKLTTETIKLAVSSLTEINNRKL